MDVMKRLLCLLAFPGALVCFADLAAVRTVYVMPMSRGLDQYLASRIASEHVFQVVTDPKLADAVLTDRIGEGLQSQLENIFPTPKPEAEEEDESQPVAKSEKGAKSDKSDKSARSDKSDAKEKPKSETSLVGAMAEASAKGDSPALSSSFGRAKGTIFLVNAKSREVVWSTYDPPKSTRSEDLDRTATDIVSRIKKDLNPKKK
jgi:hypothetical protein